MFKERSTLPEIMDDLEFEGEVMDQTLKEIETINKLLGGNAVTVNGVMKVLKKCNPDKTYSISDLGCGSGEMLKLIYAAASKEGYKIELTGIDANEYVVKYAREHCKSVPGVKFETANVLSREFSNKVFDITTCTLFVHHFTDAELIDLLKRFKKQNRLAIVINDIHRHWFAYHSIDLLTKAFSKSYMVQNDAKLSVLRAFTKNELDAIVRKAGFSRYEINWKWAFRYQVILWV